MLVKIREARGEHISSVVHPKTRVTVVRYAIEVQAAAIAGRVRNFETVPICPIYCSSATSCATWI